VFGDLGIGSVSSLCLICLAKAERDRGELGIIFTLPESEIGTLVGRREVWLAKLISC